jgi:hypothetical protein
VLVLVGYLLFAPPVLLVGPLAGLLLLTRPGTLREWLWLAVTAAWTLLWLNEGGDLASQFSRAGAVLVIGTFVALTVWRPSALFSRALTATTLAGAALIVWMWHFEVSWGAVQRGVESDLWAYNRALLVRLGSTGNSPSIEPLFAELAAMVRTVGAFYPALLFLASLAGLRLAWSWYHRLARSPLGPHPAPFAAFQFNDQLVWGGVIGLALCLLPLPQFWSVIGGNLLLVWSVVYAVRGLAVFSAGSRRVPVPVMATLTVVAMFLLPFVVGGLTLLGVADTWLDFRRRLAISTI